MSKTPISDEELKRLYETLSTQKIGTLLGRNPEGIRKRLHKLGVKMRPRGSVRTFTPSREELEAEYQSHSMRQIADKPVRLLSVRLKRRSIGCLFPLA